MNEDKQQCSECGTRGDGTELVFIEDTPFCVKCMYGDAEPFAIYPIGTVRINLRRDADRQFGLVGNSKDESRSRHPGGKDRLVLLEALRNRCLSAGLV